MLKLQILYSITSATLALRTCQPVVVRRRKKTLRLSAVVKYDAHYMDMSVAVRVRTRVVLRRDAAKSRNTAFTSSRTRLVRTATRVHARDRV